MGVLRIEKQSNNKYHIFHDWKHREGHMATSYFTEEPIDAKDVDDAVIKFKELKPELGEFIFKNKDNTYRYGNSSFYQIGY